MSNLFDKRFVINTGKGGVGKTTVSAAMAIAFAQQGKRVLLMELHTRDRVGRLFGVEPIGPEITEVAPDIHAVDTTPADAMREYALMVLRIKALYRAVFENRAVEKLLRIMPGLPELTMLGKAYFHEKERDESGRPIWDVVIIDAPATGHGMFLLQIPQVISNTLHSGRMAEESEDMLALLEDPDRTVINLVTLPEEMPVNETIELHEKLGDAFDVAVGSVVANGVFPRLLSDDETSRIALLLNTYGNSEDDLGALLSAALFRNERCEMQARYLQMLREELALPVLEIPFYFEPELDRRTLDLMAHHLTTHVGAAR